MLPAALSFSAFALSSADTVFSGAAVAATAGDVPEPTLACVFTKTSNIVCNVAGLMLSFSTCSESDGSTPNASPMHCTV